MEPTRRSTSAPHAAPSLVSDVASGGITKILHTVLMVLLIVTSIAATAWLANRLAATAGAGSAIKKKQYQALFLTNGQVYFGRVSKVDSSYVQLKDIYYLQVQQQVQPGQQPAKDANQQPNVSLAKLGSELHGPEDTMYISRDQVLFWENLKDDGKVAQAIKDYQSSGDKK